MSTTKPSTALPGPTLRSVQRELAAAPDEHIHRILALIDDLQVRGEADKLIAPLRKRLAELRPRRKLTLARLLFTPLNPVIVDAPEWSCATPALPRTAILPLTHQVKEGLGGAADRISTVALQYSPDDDIGVLVEIGADLWTEAAQILAETTIPPDWARETGLRDCDYAGLTRAASALLAHAIPLLRIAAQAKAGADPEPEELRELLEVVAPAGAQVLAMMITMAMKWMPSCELLVSVADDFSRRCQDPAMNAAADRAVKFVLTGIERAPLPSPNLAMAATEARHVAAVLDDLDRCSQQRPARRTLIEQVRSTVDAACCERFAKEVTTQLITPSLAIATADDDAIGALESAARDLRRFEMAGRQIGSADRYDRQLRRATEALCVKTDEDMGARIGRLRLVEILRGPDVAMAMLDTAAA